MSNDNALKVLFGEMRVMLARGNKNRGFTARKSGTMDLGDNQRQI